MQKSLDTLQQNLNYRFSDLNLARQALTHGSANKLNNERLEFLGDSLLGFLVAEILFESNPDAKEGELSRMRASLVNKQTLARIARQMELGDFLQLGAGELKTGGKQRDSILADALEAIIAAIYLDGGIVPCREFVRRCSDQSSGVQDSSSRQKDGKTRLQEFMQARGLELPIYRVIDIKGEAHAQTFYVECTVAVAEKAQLGVGRSKRIAEQEAAMKALDGLVTSEDAS